MALSEVDRNLLNRCLHQQPRSWEDFVDRFLGLVIHVIEHTALARSVRLSSQDEEDLAAEIFLNLVQNDFAILRRFRGESSLGTYLTVVARRIAVRQLAKQQPATRLADPPTTSQTIAHSSNDRRTHIFNASADDLQLQKPDPTLGVEELLSNREEIERLLEGLDLQTAQIVRMYHLEGKTYREISSQVGVPENSVGPTLSRARAKMRQLDVDTPLNS